MSVTRKVAYNTAVQVSGKILTTLTSLVVVGSLTRYLGLEGFGQYTTVFAFVMFFSILADFGFPTILVRELAKRAADVSRLTSTIINFRFLLGLIVYGLAFLVAWFIPTYPLSVKLGVGIVGVAWLWMTVNTNYVSLFQAKLRMDKAVITDIIGRVVILLLILWFIKERYSILAIFGAYFIGGLINLVASGALARTFFRLRFQIDLNLLKRLAKEALPMGLIIIMGTIYFKFDTIILSLFKTQVDVGIYGTPYKILEIITTFPGMFLGVVFPVLTLYYTTSDSRLLPAFQKSFDFLALVVVPVVLGLLILAKPIIGLIGGQEFIVGSTISFAGVAITAVTLLRILSIVVGLVFFTNMFGFTLVALGRQKELLVPNVMMVVLNVGLNLLLIPHFTYLAAAIVAIVTQLGVMLWEIKITHKYLSYLPNLQIAKKAIIAGAVMGVILFFLRDFSIFLTVPLAGLIYFGGLYVFRGITPEMIKLILRPKR